MILLPGIEVDVKIPKVKKRKHIIVYFDADESNFCSLAEKVNLVINKYLVSDINPIDIHILLSEFLSFKPIIKFSLSPHAFKQDDKGIDFEWKNLLE